MTSLLDGDSIEMDASDLRVWNMQTPYMKGGGARVELISHPRTGPSRIRVRNVFVGVPPSTQNKGEEDCSGGQCAAGLAGCCDGTDDRVVVSPPAPEIARIFPDVCTATLIYNNDNGCFLTAGHCVLESPGPGFPVTVIQFNGPLSLCSGSPQPPSMADQYYIDYSSIQRSPRPQPYGADWQYFGVHPHPDGDHLPIERQGAAFELASAVPPQEDPPQELFLIGHGNGTVDLRHSQVQKSRPTTHAGFHEDDGYLMVDCDVSPGDSGSLVRTADGLVIGILVARRCVGDPVQARHAVTPITYSALHDALTSPCGSCSRKAFKRGDANADGAVCGTVSDAQFILDWLFNGGSRPSCIEAANANGDDELNVSDVSYILSYCFSGGPAPPAPGPTLCGDDPGTTIGEDYLGCLDYAPCS